jgi:hypothetical protein
MYLSNTEIVPEQCQPEVSHQQNKFYHSHFINHINILCLNITTQILVCIVVIICTTSFNIQKPCIQHIYIVHVILTTNSDYFTK